MRIYLRRLNKTAAATMMTTTMTAAKAMKYMLLFVGAVVPGVVATGDADADAEGDAVGVGTGTSVVTGEAAVTPKAVSAYEE